MPPFLAAAITLAVAPGLAAIALAAIFLAAGAFIMDAFGNPSIDFVFFAFMIVLFLYTNVIKFNLNEFAQIFLHEILEGRT
jgi:hypothetical protein